jgi:Protein of unknown function (DUF3738)
MVGFGALGHCGERLPGQIGPKRQPGAPSELQRMMQTLLAKVLSDQLGHSVQPDDVAASTGLGAGQSLFSAIQEQLGLRLEARKAPVEVLVIDHVESIPTGN